MISSNNAYNYFKPTPKKLFYVLLSICVIILMLLLLTPQKNTCSTPAIVAQTVANVYIRNIQTIAQLTSQNVELADMKIQINRIQKQTEKSLYACKKSFQHFTLQEQAEAKHLAFTAIQNIYSDHTWEHYIKSFASYPTLADELYMVTNISSAIKTPLEDQN